MRNKKYVCHFKILCILKNYLWLSKILSIYFNFEYKHFLHYIHHVKYTVKCLYCALILHADYIAKREIMVLV